MTAARWQRLRDLFDAALAHEPEAHAGYLSSEESDAELRAEVMALLDADAGAPHGVAQTMRQAIVGALPQVVTGVRLGAYRLLRELGSGGMGTVFLAERADDSFHQRVAIKLLRGIPTRDGAERMRRERQILADLNHANIARLMDGGDTDDGQPYLVMEYVEGESLLAWCASRKLGAAERLRLFVPLCHAIEHAHQRLIVHRDIKPDNVLMRTDGEPMLLDFGIAKLLDDNGETTSRATRVFTPAFAAPEQQEGRAATTVTDVYGLGCVLFDLLTDGAVGRTTGGAPLPAPSTCANDAVAAQTLRGDLDVLVLKAVHPDPARRYASARALAEDIENYLTGRPLRAAPDSLAYRLRKTIVRHRYAAAAAVFALCGATVFVSRLNAERQRALTAEVRAEREAVSAQRSRDYLVSLFEQASPEASLGHVLSPRELIDRGRERLAHELKDEPGAAARVLLTISKVYAALGDPLAAATNAEEALKLAAGDTAEAALFRAEVFDEIGAAYDNLDRLDDARAAVEQSLVLRERYAPNDYRQLAHSLNGAGQAAVRRGDRVAAKTHLERALATLARAASPDPAEMSDILRALAFDALAEGRSAAALGYAERGLAALTTMPAEHPARLELWRAQARAYHAQGKVVEAAAILTQALAALRAVVGEQSTPVAHLENDLATVLNDQGRYREAIAHLESAVRILSALRPGEAIAVAIPKRNLSGLYTSLGDYATAERLAHEALEATEAATPDDHDRIDLARANLARVLGQRGDFETALSLMRDVLASARKHHGSDSVDYALAGYRMARIEQRANAVDDAALHLREATAMLETKLPPAHPVRPQLMRLRGLIARDRGDLAGARRDLEAAATAQNALTGGDRNVWAEIESDLADVLTRQHERAAARRHLETALPVFEQSLLPDAPQLQDVRQRLLELAATADETTG
jgi:eukaryotic-like serine/threonine-protein kinase